MVCAVCLFIFFLLKDLTCGFRKAEHESCYFGGWARTAMPIQAFSVVEVGGILLWEIQHIEAETKWTLFRKHFQVHFLD